MSFDPEDYPEGHSPFCHKTCDHPCHDEYDRNHQADGKAES